MCLQPKLARMGAEVVRNEPTGSGKNMYAGVRTQGYGLIHITCSSTTEWADKIRGWDAYGLSQCVSIDHVAFVWSDQSSEVTITILKKDDVLILAAKNKGQYAKQELVQNAIRIFKIP
jgi:hypothetical protein